MGDLTLSTVSNTVNLTADENTLTLSAPSNTINLGVPAAQVGEVNTGANVGGGDAEVFKVKAGTILQFRMGM